MIPSTSARFAEREGDVLYRANGLGYRGPAPASAVRRVAILGDSVAFGLGVAEAETLGARLEGMLRAAQPAAADGVRVATFAIPGYDLIDTTEAYTEDAAPWRPTDVVLQVTHNDLGTRDRVAAQRVPATRWIHAWAIGRRTRQIWGRLAGKLPGDPPRWPDARAKAELDHWRDLVDRGDERSATSFGRIATLLEAVRNSATRTVLVWVPLEGEARDGRPDPVAARLRTIAASHGAGFVDATELLHPAGSPSHTKDGMHPDAAGFAALARAIAESLDGRVPLESGLSRGISP